MKMITRLAAFGAAAGVATALAVGSAAVASADTDPAIGGTVFYVQNLEPNGHTLVLQAIANYNTKNLDSMVGERIAPGQTSGPIPVASLGMRSDVTGVIMGWEVLDSQGKVVDNTLFNNFRLKDDGSTTTQAATHNPQTAVACQVADLNLGEDLPGQCFNTATLVFGGIPVTPPSAG
jgi:hypothetical protein